MRTLQASTIALLAGLCATPSHAADAPTADPLASPSQTPIHIWSGPYAGAFVGYSSSKFDTASGPSFDGEGVVGGVYTGYNLQTEQFVYGLEADLGASGLDAGGFDRASGLPAEADTTAFGSLRGRAGVAVDPFLFFATAGVAVSNTELSIGAAEDSNTHVGYTVGAGIDAKITENLETRLEYRYSDFDSKSYDFGTTTTSAGFDEHSVRAGLALKF